MAMAVAPHRECSSGSINKHLDSGKYVRYTAEQVEALERVYAECPKPSSMRRQQLIRECPILSNIEPKQIKVWFQNRRQVSVRFHANSGLLELSETRPCRTPTRTSFAPKANYSGFRFDFNFSRKFAFSCREKQRKEASRLHTVNRKLTAMNKLLMEENDRLQKQVSQLVYENGYMRQQLQNASAGTADASCESVVTTPQHSLRDANNPAGLLSIADETLAEFLSKATGTAVDWVQMPGMKPGPDSVGIVAISQGCSGVAARACGLVSLEPTKIAEILKDRPSWFRDCRSLEVFTMFPAGNGGTIELIYMQMYAPTTLASARDFWTLRYTTSLEDGSLVVCERSLSGSGAGPNATAAPQFVRAEMLPSGYLIRPCDGGGSIIHIVDHLDLEAWSVPEVLRPLYESSKVVAQKMTIAALRHIRQIAQETSGEMVYGLGKQPAVLRTFSQRLSRGFNDAINGFSDDGWSLMNCDAAEDVVIAVNSTKNLGTFANPVNALSFPGGILCVKASMLLQNVPPALMVRFLREHRSEWADFNVDAFSAMSLKAGSYTFPGLRPTRFSGSQIIMPLGHTIEHEELLEVIRLEGHALTQEEAVLSRDIHLLQICSGLDENAVGACSELVFAPIDEMFPDDAPLLPSGFRIIPLDSKTDTLIAHRTLDLASSLEVGPATNRAAGEASLTYNKRSVLTIAFQFPFEDHLRDNVATMARQYVRSVISSVQRVAMAIAPSGLSPHVGPKLSPGSPEALTLAQWISQSYRQLPFLHLGAELLRSDCRGGDSVLKLLWHHQDAILCCSLKSLPVFTFANQAGLDMLETTLVALQDITLDKIFDEPGRKALCSDFTKIMQQGFAYLPAGICMSTMGRHVSFEEVVAWKVVSEENTVHCLAFAFVNWSFV
ncbi:hypothetical protein HHK36_010840 [Tetracentron sinense]|uniref:Uncharacterized protein n=1 Tax=Tetracentron sinense TaxID=13715 RepID=A0A834ZB74_TETSI|nr:hypothetical protein HHK36_010840 [Tetracentron sinense]